MIPTQTKILSKKDSKDSKVFRALVLKCFLLIFVLCFYLLHTEPMGLYIEPMGLHAGYMLSL